MRGAKVAFSGGIICAVADLLMLMILGWHDEKKTAAGINMRLHMLNFWNPYKRPLILRLSSYVYLYMMCSQGKRLPCGRAVPAWLRSCLYGANGHHHYHGTHHHRYHHHDCYHRARRCTYSLNQLLVLMREVQ
jgi:hypothetical protein